ncbi:saccharopine dehydrogenase [Syncephalis plumigaleata]|nr:saccharopine dehydrogenase [Syncephalis plumigaleata]
MSASTGPHLWLRAEVKPMEHRAALTPSVCAELKKNGFRITVEHCNQRIFKDAEYETVGCEMAPHGSWQTQAPADAYIVGLKELPEEKTPLKHTHIFFAHCYKQQAGWQDILDDSVMVMVDVWQLCTPYPAITPYSSDQALIGHVRDNLAAVEAKTGKKPRVMVMGALGRCGRGAVDFAQFAGIADDKLLRWDMAETKNGGPFEEILASDIFINCIYLSQPIPPFVTKEMLDRADRPLTMVVDVSCDTTNPHNPIPIYSVNTTFDKPLLDVPTQSPRPLQVIAIDHLPTALPRESSEAFSRDLLPSLLELKHRDTAPVWTTAEALFKEKSALLS